MKLTGTWLTRTETQAVCAMLTEAGHLALLVGGCVRNGLLGAPVADIDITTDAPPERVMALANAARLKPVPTGIDHGTITVIAGGLPHEVTTLRRDVQSHGRHATVAWSDDVAEDAARRDFTMNALYAQPDGTVIDPLGGLPDLKARRVRFVGQPADRITEDYLRILRFFRFHAWYGDPEGGIDPEGLAACAAHAKGIARLSRERIGAEMRKLLAAPDPAPAVAAMQATGVLAQALPGSDARALPLLIHLEDSAGTEWHLRLAVLGGDDPAGALRLSRNDARRVALLRAEAAGVRSAAELGYRHGAAMAGDIVPVRAALLETPPPPGWRAEVLRGARATFPLRAADLMPRFAGPELGAELHALEERWIASDFTLTRDQLLM